MSQKEPGLDVQAIEALLEASAAAPELRLGQLLINVVRPKSPCPEVFYVEDSRLIELLREFAKARD